MAEIKHYRPRNHKFWSVDEGRAEIYGEEHVIFLFTYPGGEHGDAFTTLELYRNGKVFRCRFPRHYKDRWWRRIATDFEWDVIKMEDAK